jgi:hypothetical protein
MEKQKYSEKLKDPRWQKKRLEIFERDKWMCQKCLNKDLTLHVHHLWYLNNKEPWEYDNDLLLTLCTSCHDVEHETRPYNEQVLLQILKTSKYFSEDVLVLASFLGQLQFFGKPTEITAALKWGLIPKGGKKIGDKIFKKLLSGYRKAQNLKEV